MTGMGGTGRGDGAGSGVEQAGVADEPVAARVPLRAWLRPILFTVVGLAVALLLLLIHQGIAGIALGLFALFMGYWTSPLRGGQHTPFTEAMARRGPDHAIIFWAPGEPLSARLQTAIRGHREDVTWVNVYRDPDAEAFVHSSGGHGAIPMVVVGDRILRRASVGDYLDARAEAEGAGGGAGASGDGADDLV